MCPEVESKGLKQSLISGRMDALKQQKSTKYAFIKYDESKIGMHATLYNHAPLTPESDILNSGTGLYHSK